MSEILSESTKEKVQEIAINPSENFLNGTNTSPFAVVSKTLSTASSAINAVGAGIQSASLMAEVTVSCLDNLKTELMSYVATKTVELMKLPVEKFTEAMNTEIKEGMIKIKEATKLVSTDSEDLIKEEQENLLKEQEEKVKNGASEKIKQMTEKVTKVLDDAKKSIDSIVKTINGGPNWLEDKLNGFRDSCIEQTGKGLNQLVESFEKTKNTWAENAGKSTGKIITTPSNQKTLKALKNIQDKIQEVKNQAISKAKSLIAKAEMNIKGLLGG